MQKGINTDLVCVAFGYFEINLATSQDLVKIKVCKFNWIQIFIVKLVQAKRHFVLH